MFFQLFQRFLKEKCRDRCNNPVYMGTKKDVSNQQTSSFLIET